MRSPPCSTSITPANPESGFRTSMAVDRKSTRLNSSHANISYAVFCLKKKKLLSLPLLLLFCLCLPCDSLSPASLLSISVPFSSSHSCLLLHTLGQLLSILTPSCPPLT